MHCLVFGLPHVVLYLMRNAVHAADFIGESPSPGAEFGIIGARVALNRLFCSIIDVALTPIINATTMR